MSSLPSASRSAAYSSYAALNASSKAKLKAKAKEQKAAEKAAEKEAEAKREARDTAKVAVATRLWARMAEACKANNVEFAALAADANSMCYWDWRRLITGEATVSSGYAVSPLNDILVSDLEAVCRMADALGVSVDYLLCRTDEPTTSTPSAPKWHTGDPPRDGEYLIKYDANEFGGAGTDVDYYEKDAWGWTVGAVNLRWCEIPEE